MKTSKKTPEEKTPKRRSTPPAITGIADFQDQRSATVAQTKQQELIDQSPRLIAQGQQQNWMTPQNASQQSPAQLMAAQLMAATHSAVTGETDWATATAQWSKASEVLQGKDWKVVHSTAMDTFRSRQEALQRTPDGRVVQRAGETWADWLSDGLSVTAIIGAGVSSIAQWASASGWGWIIPLSLAPIASFVRTGMEIQGTISDEKSAKQKWLENVANLAFALGAAAIVTAGNMTEDKWPSALAATLSTLALMVLEFFRVKFLDRESIYGAIIRKIQECRKGSPETASLL